jgi:hypothetical protein
VREVPESLKPRTIRIDGQTAPSAIPSKAA